MAIVTTHRLARRERFLSALHGKGFGHFDLTERRTTVVCTVAIGAASQTIFGSTLVARNPGACRCVHAMRSTTNGIGHADMASCAFAHGTGMALQVLTEYIVIYMRTGVLGMGGTVAGLALQTAMASTETVQVETTSRCVGIGSKALICPNFGCAICIDTTDFALSIMVARLASGLTKPAGTGAAADRRHAAVATLAIHGRFPGSAIQRIAHGTTQALGFGARVA